MHLSAHCDAVEELVRFAEANDGKLPAHPAYLEVRRILTTQAQATPLPIAGIHASVVPEPREEPAAAVAAPIPAAVSAPQRPARNLPKAKTW
jgi:hypothetical protein